MTQHAKITSRNRFLASGTFMPTAMTVLYGLSFPQSVTRRVKILIEKTEKATLIKNTTLEGVIPFSLDIDL